MYQIILLIMLSFFGASSIASSVPDQSVTEIKQVLQIKETAVNNQNKKLFLSLLHPGNPMYIQEQKHWFDDAVVYLDANSFRLKPVRIQFESKELVKVWVSQAHSHGGKKVAVTYPLRLKKTKRGWKDADIAFQAEKKGPFMVYYTDDRAQKQAQLTLRTLQKATEAFSKKYQWRPNHIEVKLYHQPEVFRQSVKPSLPTWAGGWHESKQAIKFIGGLIDDGSFSQGIVHELTHQMVSELTNDNAAYWLQEGAAMYYERHLYGRPTGIPANDSLFSLAQIEKMNLENLPDKEASRYYVSCYYLFQSLVNKYEEKRIKEMLLSLQSYPEIDLESAQKISTLNERTRKSMRRLKMTLE